MATLITALQTVLREEPTRVVAEVLTTLLVRLVVQVW
jgi:hypothetical protein